MSELKVNTITEESSSTLTLGKAGTNVVLAAGATQTGFGTDTDLTPLQNDLAVLALHQAIDSNKSAYSLQNTWVEQFEDSDSITDLTDCDRVSAGEYIATATEGVADYTTDPYASGDRTSLITVTDGTSFWSIAPSTDQLMVNGVTNTDTNYGYMTTDPTGHWVKFDFGSGVTKLVTGLRIWLQNSHGQDYRFEASNDDSNWTTLGSAYSFQGAHLPVEPWTGLSHTTKYRYYRLYGTDNGSTSGGYIREVEFKIVPTIASAAGSFTSVAITPQDSASKSSLGLVLLYKDHLGTNTLNTDLIAQVSADNGVTYSDCVLASRGDFSAGLKTAIAPAVDVTSGNQLKYKISFANQAQGTKEARVHGVSLQY